MDLKSNTIGESIVVATGMLTVTVIGLTTSGWRMLWVFWPILISLVVLTRMANVSAPPPVAKTDKRPTRDRLNRHEDDEDDE